MNIKIFNKGFTLIELIVVMAIISVLSTAILVILNPSTQLNKGNDARRKSDLSQVQKALEQYYQDNGKYPANTATYQILGAPWGGSWSNYMNVVPKDQNSSKKYVYYSPSTSNGQTYYLYASLDRGSSDPQACNKGNACSSLATNNISSSACGGTCNFGVSTPNVSP